MKVFVCYALLATIAINYAGAASSSISNAGAISSSSSSGASLNPEAESEVQAPVNQGLIDLTRLRKSAYGGGGAQGGYGGGAPAPASIPAPPCPKNYLFSCQPNLAPVPCSGVSASQGYGSAGAYSSPIASYVNPNYGHPHHQPIYAANPAAFLPQAYAYQY